LSDRDDRMVKQTKNVVVVKQTKNVVVHDNLELDRAGASRPR
jgi:hypothetical protein